MYLDQVSTELSYRIGAQMHLYAYSGDWEGLRIPWACLHFTMSQNYY